MEYEQKVPYSAEAEQVVLGSILLDPRQMEKAVTLLAPEHFYIEKHRRIFTAMLELYNLSQPIEAVMLIEKMRESDSFDEQTDKEYLISLAESASMIGNIEQYSKIIKEKAGLRHIIGTCQDVSEMCYDNEELAKVLDIAQQRFFDISIDREQMNLRPIDDVVREEMQRFSDIEHDDSGKFEALKTGISSLDEFIGGLNKGNLIILAARPGVGKTSLALNVAYNVARGELPCYKFSKKNPKKDVVFFSLEMSNSELAQRVLSSVLSIDSKVLQTGKLSRDDWASLHEIWPRLKDTKLLLSDSTNVTINEIKSKLRQRKNLGLVVVDYLQLMMGTEPGQRENVVQQVSALTRSLKIMAKELNVPIIVLSQMSRSIEQRQGDKTPRLSDLRDSGSIEQDADVVIFINKDDSEENSNIRELIVAKNRHGQTGKLRVYWDGSHTSFKAMSDSKPRYDNKED